MPLYIYISVYIYKSLHIYIYISIYLYSFISIYLQIYIYIYIYLYLSKRFALSSGWYSNPKPTLNQTLYKDILNQLDDNIKWNYCALLCLNLHSTCFQGACRVVYTPWVSHSTQHLACENRCFQSALIPPPAFFNLNSNLHTFQ